ncbi:MAG: anhydro-N-acetylmuramic acid kinase [Pseudomonadota bacterium]
MEPELYIGLMSGTSMDGVDGVLIDLAPGASFRILAHHHAAFDPSLRESLFALNQPGADELHRAALAGNGLALAYAKVVTALLQQSGVAAQQVRAIGAHGQTVRHRPGEFDGIGYTCQLLNTALLAERSGIDVVADFRSRDVAAGGQGAPLVPAFHQAAFATPGRDIAVLNVGGIANITFLPASGHVRGHDCGPGNVLLDLWCDQHTGRPFDADGAWARGGQISAPLLQAMLQDSYLQRTPPKSTGRDHFNGAWLQRVLAACMPITGPLAPQDVQRTLVQFTARAAAADVLHTLPAAEQLLVCGGGALNGCLMDSLRLALPGVDVRAINQICAMDPMHVEAAAFAWLAQASCEGEPANMPAVTGATDYCLLGALYRAAANDIGLGPMLEPAPPPPAQPHRHMFAAEPNDSPGQMSLLDQGSAPPPALFHPEAVQNPSGELKGYNLFLAIFPPPELAQRVGPLAADLRQQHGLHGQRLQEQHLHMTLHAVAWFHAEIPLQQIEAAMAAAAGIRCPALPITFDRAGSFHNRSNPGNNAFVLQCDAPSNASVARLRQQLAVALRRSGLRPTPTSTPHMTLLYDRKVVEEQPIQPIQWTATRFALILSHVGLGHHQWLGEWQLH